MTEATPLISVRDLAASYGHIEALRPTSLHVAPGEFVTILGPNGAGKTTLLRAITRLIPSKGQVLFNGQDVTGLKTHDLAKLGIIMVMEGRGLFGDMSVRENLQLGAYKMAGSQADLDRRLDKVFTLFPRLKERIDQTASSMSGGEQQMLAVGRALMAEPKLLILDEPSRAGGRPHQARPGSPTGPKKSAAGAQACAACLHPFLCKRSRRIADARDQIAP